MRTSLRILASPPPMFVWAPIRAFLRRRASMAAERTTANADQSIHFSPAAENPNRDSLAVGLLYPLLRVLRVPGKITGHPRLLARVSSTMNANWVKQHAPSHPFISWMVRRAAYPLWMRRDHPAYFRYAGLFRQNQRLSPEE